MVFHTDMKKQEIAAALEARFGYLRTASDRELEELEESLRERAVPGHPISQRNLQIFRYADEERERDVTQREAISRAVERYSLDHKTAQSYDNDNEDAIDTLIRLYQDYHHRIDGGLDTSITYPTSAFFDYILQRQWAKAAAIFITRKKSFRAELCNKLNRCAERQ